MPTLRRLPKAAKHPVYLCSRWRSHTAAPSATAPAHSLTSGASQTQRRPMSTRTHLKCSGAPSLQGGETYLLSDGAPDSAHPGVPLKRRDAPFIRLFPTCARRRPYPLTSGRLKDSPDRVGETEHLVSHISRFSNTLFNTS